MNDASALKQATHEEIELKLAVPSRLAARVASHLLIERHALDAPATRRVVSVYYDTPRFELMASGMALRLRQTDSGWLQAIKYGGGAIAGLHRRREIEMPVAAQTPDLSVLATIEPASTRPRASVSRRLAPVFVIDIERTTRRLLLPNACEVELCVDRGSIVAGTARTPICELELEMKSGDPAALFDFVQAIEAPFRARAEPRSKAERGYGLAGYRGKPAKASTPAIGASASVGDAIVAILASGLAQMQANEHGMLADRDPEYLHQMRVAVRRLRSGLAACSPVLPPEPFAAIRAELKWLGARLGEARDWDVLLGEVWPPLHAEYPERADIARFERSSGELRAGARRAAASAVQSRRYARLVFALGRIVATRDWRDGVAELAGALGPFAAKLLERRYKGVVDRGPGKQRLSIAELHALRIAIKKLRYALEFFSGLYDAGKVKRFRDRLVDLQDLLGRINDASTLHAVAHRVLPNNRRFEYIVTGWNARVIHEERERLRARWRELRRLRKLW